MRILVRGTQIRKDSPLTEFLHQKIIIIIWVLDPNKNPLENTL